jgi:uncharacterized protein (TIGR03435 family)
MLAIVLGTTVALAQALPAPSFEVASIRENTSGASGGGTRLQPGGRWSATNLSVASLIAIAHGLNSDDRVLNAPDWTRGTRYDINAIGTPGFANEDVPAAMRALLRERFGMVARVEKRDLPAYDLTVLRPDGRLGPAIRPAAVNCMELAARRATTAVTPEAPAPNAAGANGAPTGIPCGIRWSNAGTLIEAGGVTAEALAVIVSGAAGRPVIDKTGLAGMYDVQLRHSGPDPAAGGDGVSIFTAVQEQLGLRLENSTAPLDVVVVDRISRPTVD